MELRLLLSLFLLLASPVWAAVVSAPVQTASTSSQTANGSNQVSLVMASATGGNALDVGMFWKGAGVTVSSVSGCGGTWEANPNGQLNRPTDGFLNLYGGRNLTAGACTILVTFSGPPDAGTVYLYGEERSGVITGSSMFDAAAGAKCTGTATSGTTVSCSSTITPTYDNGAIVGYGVSDDTNGSAGSGFTARINTPGDGAALEDKLFGNQLSAAGTTVSYVNSTAVTKAAVLGAVILAQPGAETGCILLEDNVSFVLHENGTDRFELEGGGAGLCVDPAGGTTWPGYYGNTGGWN